MKTNKALVLLILVLAGLMLPTSQMRVLAQQGDFPIFPFITHDEIPQYWHKTYEVEGWCLEFENYGTLDYQRPGDPALITVNISVAGHQGRKEDFLKREDIKIFTQSMMDGGASGWDTRKFLGRDAYHIESITQNSATSQYSILLDRIDPSDWNNYYEVSYWIVVLDPYEDYDWKVARVNELLSQVKIITPEVPVGKSEPVENHPPEVDLSFSPKYPTPSDTVYLTATASDPDGDPLTYTWFLNEERMDLDPGAKQMYLSDLEAGDYWVSVQVSDEKGGTDNNVVMFSVKPLLAFTELKTGKQTYDFNETVRVIYSLKNWGDKPLDYYVEYRILDSSKKEVFYYKGADHSIQPGESQEFKSEKYVIPDDVKMGTYEIKAKCISESGDDVENAFFNVVSIEINISYLLGYEMPFFEENPVPLRIKFKLAEDSGIIGITSIEILDQTPQIFFSDPDLKGRIEFEKPGVEEAAFDFSSLLSKNLMNLLPIRGEKTVSFVVRIGIFTLRGSSLTNYEQESEIEIPVKVKIKASFTVCAVDVNQSPEGETIAPQLDGVPLTLDKSCSQPIKGFDGGELRIFNKTRVLLRDLSGAAFSIGDYGGGDTGFWEVSLSQASSKELEQYQISDSAIRAQVRMYSEEKGEDEALDFLFERVIGKTKAGYLGIIMELFKADEIGGENIRRAVIKLRSILGVSIPKNGDIVIRNYEGSPEILMPDGSTLELPPGHETVMDSYGYFSEPKIFDTSTVIGPTDIGSLPSGGETTQILGDHGDNDQDSFLPWVAAAGGFFVVVAGALILKARKKPQKPTPAAQKTPSSRHADTSRRPGLGTSSSAKKASSTQDKRICPNCGQPVRAGAAFCRNCGQKIK